MKRQHFTDPVFLVRLGGTLFLGIAYTVWRLEVSPLSLAGQLASLASLGLFWGVGFRFAPVLVNCWTPGSPLAKPPVYPGPDPWKVQLALLGILPVFCAACYASVYLLRLAAGYSATFQDSLGVWTGLDSAHYLDIARDWYLSQGPWDRLVQLVFLPGYPLVIRLAAWVTGDYLLGAIAADWIAFALAGGLLYRLLRLDFCHRDALWGVAFLCLSPGSFFFAAPMSESLFLLLCLGCLYLGRTRRWLAACLVGGLAAFTRSLGITLVVPLLFELIQAQTHPPRHSRRAPGTLLAALAQLCLVPAGFGAYCWINYQVAGDPLQFMEYQQLHWSQQTGWFFNTAAYHIDLLLEYLSANLPEALGLWLPNFLACLLSLGIMLAAARKLRPSYIAWFMVYFSIAAGTTWLLSAPRYMVVFFPLAAALGQLFPSLSARCAAAFCLALAGGGYLVAFALGWQVW